MVFKKLERLCDEILHCLISEEELGRVFCKLTLFAILKLTRDGNTRVLTCLIFYLVFFDLLLVVCSFVCMVQTSAFSEAPLIF